MGDLNNIMRDIDTTSANVNKYRMRAFNTYVKQCGLFEGYSGPAYTWTNKRFSSNPVFERLDRCLVNAEWCGLFPNTNVFNLPIILSDHAPILVSTPKLHLNLKTGGPLKMISKTWQGMLGTLLLISLSMPGLLTFQDQ